MKPYTINWIESTFHLTFHGQIVLDDLLAAHNALVADAKLDSAKTYIVDFRHVTKFSVSARELRIYARYDAVMPLFLRCYKIRGAYLATSSEMSQRLNEFINQGHYAWERKIFFDDNAAIEWINRENVSLAC